MREADSKLKIQEDYTTRLKIDLKEKEEYLEKQEHNVEKDQRCIAQMKEQLDDNNHMQQLEMDTHLR